MFVGITNRKPPLSGGEPLGLRSRGLLAREVLRTGNARKGVDKAMEELLGNRYEHLNLIVCDGESGWVIHSNGEPEVQPLEEGLNIVGEYDVNDPNDERIKLAHRLLTLQLLDSPVKFLAVASKVFARSPSPAGRPSMVIRGEDFGTVSSTLIALGPKPRDAIFQYSTGAPDEAKYEDYSPMLRDILSRGLREARTKVKAS